MSWVYFYQINISNKPLSPTSLHCCHYCWCLFANNIQYLSVSHETALFDILCWPLSLSFFVTQRAVLVCAMEMVGALWVTMAGTACASWAGGALAVTPLWKLPAVMSRTMMEVKSQRTLNKAFCHWPSINRHWCNYTINHLCSWQYMLHGTLM